MPEHEPRPLPVVGARRFSSPVSLRLRPARPGDVHALAELIAGYAQRGLLLPRDEVSLRAALADFVVALEQAEAGWQIVGCGALARLGPGLGEVRSMAVRTDAAGRGVGRRIVRCLLRRARVRGLVRILAVTRRASFFEALGFEATRRESFPEKLRADCHSCPRHLHCDEVALVLRRDARLARAPTRLRAQPGAALPA